MVPLKVLLLKHLYELLSLRVVLLLELGKNVPLSCWDFLWRGLMHRLIHLGLIQDWVGLQATGGGRDSARNLIQ